MKAFVIRFSSLGDCVLLCPFLEHLKSHGAAEVTVLTKRAYAELFSAARGVDRVIALSDGAGLRGLFQIVEAHKNKGHTVIDAHNTWRSRFVAGRLGGAEVRVEKYHRRRLGLILLKRHAPIPTVSARYSALAERLGFSGLREATGGLEIPPPVRRRAVDRLSGVGGDFVAMAPGSRWPMKRWGEAKYFELARRLVRSHGLRVLLLGDASDVPTTSRIAESLGADGIDLSGRTGILEAAAIIERAVAFIGNDSGLMHLAEAVGVPVLALFGPTVESFGYYPSLPASRVVERNLSCRPCSRNGSRPCPKGNQECLTGIDVESVEKAFSGMREGIGPRRHILP